MELHRIKKKICENRGTRLQMRVTLLNTPLWKGFTQQENFLTPAAPMAPYQKRQPGHHLSALWVPFCVAKYYWQS